MKTIEAFFEETLSDKVLAQKLEQAYKEDRLPEFLAQQDVVGTVSREKPARERNSHELEDDELEQAAGGRAMDGDDWGVCKSVQGVQFKYHTGDRVQYFISKVVWGTVEETKIAYHALMGYYPFYKLRLDNGIEVWCMQANIRS